MDSDTKNTIVKRWVFEDDDLDWLLGEIEHTVSVANSCGALLYKCDPDLAQAALDFFRLYYQRLDLEQEKVNFESVRISDEEWNRRWQEKIRRICSGLPLDPAEPPRSAK